MNTFTQISHLSCLFRKLIRHSPLEMGNIEYCLTNGVTVQHSVHCILCITDYPIQSIPIRV